MIEYERASRSREECEFAHLIASLYRPCHSSTSAINTRRFVNFKYTVPSSSVGSSGAGKLLSQLRSKLLAPMEANDSDSAA